ncbi:MAG TPA: hypothetical protein PKD51_11495 [Saprospiraceae bacterium]|nr:hypothetical protein [Saprospiraceae bacterium]HMU05897.1 hypothetical protein [Saprospiraceae bacterium]
MSENKTTIVVNDWGDYNLEIGEKVYLWCKPETYEINVYKKGTEMGEGFIGFQKNKNLYLYLKNRSPYKASVFSKSNGMVFIDVITQVKIAEPESWFLHGLLVFPLLYLFYPLGVYLLWLKNYSFATKIVWTVLFFITFIAIYIL